MPRKTSSLLTDAELRLMRILWQHGPGSVHDVQAHLSEDEPLAYNSVLTTLRVLENKGYVGHRKEGRAHIYEALRDRASVKKGIVKYLLDRFFDDSPEELVVNLVETGDISEVELGQIQRRLKKEKSKRARNE